MPTRAEDERTTLKKERKGDGIPDEKSRHRDFYLEPSVVERRIDFEGESFSSSVSFTDDLDDVNIFGSMSMRWKSQKLFDLAKSSTADPGEDGPFYGLGPQLATFSLDRDLYRWFDFFSLAY